MANKAEIEKRIRAEVEAEVTKQTREEREREERNAQRALVRKAGDKAEAPFLSAIEKAESKATVVWNVEQYDCEGRYSTPWGAFASKAEADKARGGSNYYTEPRRMLVWASKADFSAYQSAKSEASSARRAAESKQEEETGRGW